MKLLRYYLAGLATAFFCAAPVQAQELKPMIQTQWGQAAPYNMFCPVDTVTHRNVLAGCGPIAMAQIIRYNCQPEVSPKGEKYQWDLMSQHPSTPQEANAIARLVADCGVNAFTNFGADNSTTKNIFMVNALKKHFGYNPYIAIVKRELYPGDEGRSLWRKLIMDELQGGRPVMMCGSKSDAADGHIFIIDGVRGSQVHVNFGWDGRSDGYYPLDDLCGYNTEQRAIIGLGKADYVPEITEIKTQRPGQLAELLPQNEWKLLHHLRISGPLDKSDFRVLQQMSRDDILTGRSGFLHSLDLSDAEVEYLPDSAFCVTHSLFYVRLPKRLKEIGRDAFNSCIWLNEVDIPSTVWRIRRGAFNNCFNLLNIHIPEGVHNVLSYTFHNCYNLTEVRLPESVDTLGAFVFDGCRRLERLYIPAATTHIGVGLLNGCNNIKIVDINPFNRDFHFSGGKIVGLSRQAQEQLGEIRPDPRAPSTLEEFIKSQQRRVRKVKVVKRNGKWVEVK